MSAAFGLGEVSVERGTGGISGLTVEAERGTVTVVAGGDGAGKTTALQVLAGALAPHTGTVRRPPARRLGYVPAGGGSYPDLTIAENLDFVAAVFALDARRAATRATELLERTELAPFRDRLARRLSGGQRQKLALVLALLAEPELLVLDEPTTGLDPVSRAELWRLLARAAGDGRSVVASTTYLDEAERAGHVVVLDDGVTLMSGTPSELRASLPGAVVDTDRPHVRARSWRVGARWREWRPDAEASAPPPLGDVVVAAQIARREGAPW